MRKKRVLIGLVAVAGAALAGGLVLLDSQQPDDPPARSQPSPQKNLDVMAERFAALPVREEIGKPRGEPFGTLSAVRSAVLGAAAREEAAPARPVAPPLPYRIAGQVTNEGVFQVVLAREDRVFAVREGDRLDDAYRVESIRPDRVVLLYLPLGLQQELPVAGPRLDTTLLPPLANPAPKDAPSAQPEPRAALLRFEGPRRVQAGANFDVALKVTSAEPLSSAPVQLLFDATRLEPLAVRPGELFADGRFSYRVNPEGSIFVGASANGAMPADADFLVVTFRPLRAGDAELKVSSVALQGEAGRAIAHEAPAAFRTAIVQ